MFLIWVSGRFLFRDVYCCTQSSFCRHATSASHLCRHATSATHFCTQCFARLRHFRSSPSGFSFFTAFFSWVFNKNLQHDHCSSICNALIMITGVMETFAICRLYRFHWPWFSLLGYLALPLFEICFFSRPVCLGLITKIAWNLCFLKWETHEQLQRVQ